MLVVYGEKPTSDNDELLQLAEECVDLLANRIASGGIWPVDIFPSCTSFINNPEKNLGVTARTVKHIPTWFPGAGFKRNSIVWKAKMLEMVNKPYERVKEEMVRANFLMARLFD